MLLGFPPASLCEVYSTQGLQKSLCKGTGDQPLVPAIPSYRIEDSDSNCPTSSAHTAPDIPSCTSDNAASLHFTESHSIALMDSDEHFQILKQELAESKHRSEVMGQALDAIMSKLNINPNEQRVEEDSDFRKN